MQTQQDLPPNFDDIKKVVEVDLKHTVFTHGTTIFNPGGVHLSPDLIVHEMIHMGQQVKSPELWWERWLTDKEFRMEQELTAYAHQYSYFCSEKTDRNQRHQFLWQLALQLSAPMYGSICKASEALKLIRSKSGVPDKHYA